MAQENERYEFYYMDLRGIGEPIRYIFAYLELPFEDKRAESLNWSSVKNDFKWGQLPELHINGDKVLTQSRTLGRYLARKYGLMPGDNFEKARCDEIVDSLFDLSQKIKKYILIKFYNGLGNLDESKKEICSKDMPLFLKNINEILLENWKATNAEGNFILGSNISWSDFYLSHFTYYWEEILEEPDLLNDYDAIKKQQSAVLQLPQIKLWNEKRPKSII